MGSNFYYSIESDKHKIVIKVLKFDYCKNVINITKDAQKIIFL
ncbi:hypothetical protein SAMN04488541_101062 [Thermoflexibacter ruber]|uniref:Uncharacterized protein n=1 Tax=Thermoflexibacter ruber TaxID=1003 RepID=A0A1I2EL07_9BACT|nr:hypothetical protein SAMN04488541_101062 [Thermoflexibacter ruber]